ncbi:MAG: hypothetical protein HKM04_10755 [Legionellales bacterium]|nr:hypothetical protein [Legionellales bacterium]
MNKSINELKLLTLMFIVGSLVLAAVSFLFLKASSHRWVLLGLYTWSGSLFIIYKVTQFLKAEKQNGTLKKQ